VAVIRYFLLILLWEEGVVPLLPKQVLLVALAAAARAVVRVVQEPVDKDLPVAGPLVLNSQVVVVVVLAQLEH